PTRWSRRSSRRRRRRRGRLPPTSGSRRSSRPDPQAPGRPSRGFPRTCRTTRTETVARRTDDDPRRYLDPKVIARISQLDLRARQVVEGFLSGMHKSPVYGQSVEFVQHREYIPGDDLLRIDWKVWQRSDKFDIQQFE